MPTDEDTSAELDKLKATSFDEVHVRVLAAPFLEWLERYTSHNYQERARKAAAARWTKKRRKRKKVL